MDFKKQLKLPVRLGGIEPPQGGTTVQDGSCQMVPKRAKGSCIEKSWTSWKDIRVSQSRDLFQILAVSRLGEMAQWIKGLPYDMRV